MANELVKEKIVKQMKGELGELCDSQVLEPVKVFGLFTRAI